LRLIAGHRMRKPEIHADGPAGRQPLGRADEEQALATTDIENGLVTAPPQQVEQPVAKRSFSPPAVLDHAERAVQEVRAYRRFDPSHVQTEDRRLEKRQRDRQARDDQLGADDGRRVEAVVGCRAAAHRCRANGWLRSYPRSAHSMSRGSSSDHQTTTRPLSDRSAASCATMSATSWIARSRAGTPRSTRSAAVRDSQYRRGPSVAIQPGARQLIRMPSPARSASADVNRITAPLATS